jgi:hypothetical protein
MVRIEVDSDWLGTASTGHRTLGDQFAGMHGAIAETATGAVSAAGDPALGHGIGAASERFGAGLRSMALEMHGLATNLAAAGEAYRVTDESVMPRA